MVLEFVREVLAGTARANQEAYYRLHAAGVLKQNRDGTIAFRCETYRRYLGKHLQ